MKQKDMPARDKLIIHKDTDRQRNRKIPMCLYSQLILLYCF